LNPAHAIRTPLLLLTLLLPVFIWSWIDPFDRLIWWLEAFPAILAVILLAATFEKFRLTDLVYILIAAHAVLLLVGAHYTYARMPVFNLIRDAFELERNHFDRLGHFVQGFVPAMIARELLLRTSPMRPGKWLFAIIVMSCAGISALFEVFEWLIASVGGASADDFLALQGDVWDTQKDMLLATVGAAMALGLLGRQHDTQLRRLAALTPPPASPGR